MNIVLIAAMSADGKIAEFADQTSTEWTSLEDTDFFRSKTKELEVVIVGRKTFKTIGHALPNRLNIVMTSDPEAFYAQQKEGLLEFTSDTPQEIIEDLEERGFESAALIGGRMVYSRFLQEGLVNEAYLTVEPLLFGGGVPLADGFDRIEMTLIDVERLGDSAVLLHYRI